MIAASMQNPPAIRRTPVATNRENAIDPFIEDSLHPGHEEPEFRMHDARHVVDRAGYQAGPIGRGGGVGGDTIASTN